MSTRTCIYASQCRQKEIHMHSIPNNMVAISMPWKFSHFECDIFFCTGAKGDIQDHNGRTPLQIAEVFGYEKVHENAHTL